MSARPSNEDVERGHVAREVLEEEVLELRAEVALLKAVAKAARAHAEGVGPDGYCAEHDAVEKALADLDAHDAAGKP